MPRLFNLVRVREGKLRPAFYFALRNTLVAQDLEQASRIAYGHGGKWARVVTMQVLALLPVLDGLHACLHRKGRMSWAWVRTQPTETHACGSLEARGEAWLVDCQADGPGMMDLYMVLDALP